MKARLSTIFIRIMSLLPLEMARKFGKLLGICLYLFKTRAYKTTSTNLRLCYPQMSEEARDRLARQSLINTGMTIAESGAVWLWPVERVLGKVLDVEGLDLVEKARQAGKGVIFIGPHHGNWELIGLYLSSLGNCSQLYLPPKQALLDRMIYQARKRAGAAMYPANSRGVSAVLKALKTGEMTGILPDQVPAPGAGEFAPFFGRQAYTMSLIPRLLHKTDALAFLCYAKRVKGGFSIKFKQADKDIYAGHMQTALTALNRTVELAISDAPEQYQWEYKRFRYQPEGQQEPYSA